ncbi:hypothetical protein [Acidianus sp. HS-5]|uniref:hypothetical protein n=1 Tax=Acidianus sp. HS-5 TaxID=2886040 RepID=UPI001F3E1CFB|nr:hypothetical protein [Acidianus sp. HS-5]BDC19539.1 hypothetical protein HS5_24290 [Acidianus sp. HS-5]
MITVEEIYGEDSWFIYFMKGFEVAHVSQISGSRKVGSIPLGNRSIVLWEVPENEITNGYYVNYNPRPRLFRFTKPNILGRDLSFDLMISKTLTPSPLVQLRPRLFGIERTPLFTFRRITSLEEDIRNDVQKFRLRLPIINTIEAEIDAMLRPTPQERVRLLNSYSEEIYSQWVLTKVIEATIEMGGKLVDSFVLNVDSKVIEILYHPNPGIDIHVIVSDKRENVNLGNIQNYKDKEVLQIDSGVRTVGRTGITVSFEGNAQFVLNSRNVEEIRKFKEEVRNEIRKKL